MNYAGYKRDFIFQLAKSGDSSANAVEPYLINAVPERLRVRWMERFYNATRPADVPAQPRLLNHFKLGADPEFTLISLSGGLQHAEGIGLSAGLCVGADNNGRLVELRPAPSRFALEVVASMLTELRWLAVAKSRSAQYQWKAGAFDGHDGLGGHVHFGRKQAGPKGQHLRSEVNALDTLTTLLFASEVFNKKEMDARRGSSHGGHYGAYGDTRAQAHGYEYRTLPSWLNSPWLAYLSLTLSKLAVHDPTFFQYIPRELTQSSARKWIRNTLARYKGLDEDARLAFLGLDVWGLPKAVTYPVDFKPAWGLLPPQSDSNWLAGIDYPIPQYLPTSIKPSAQDVSDIFKLIVYGKAITTWLPSAPTWPFQFCSPAHVGLQKIVNTRISPGLGELTWDGIIPAKGPELVVSVYAKEGRSVQISPDLARHFDLKGLRERFKGVNFEIRRDWGAGHILFSKALLAPSNISYARQIFYSGFFPVARYDNPDGLKDWVAKFAQPRKEFKVNRLSKVLYKG